MPLYEYRCESCGHTFEVIQRFSDAPVEKCPTCGGPVQKLLSPSAIHFKGTGWYVTDYAKKDRGGASSSPKSANGASSSSESKPTSGSDAGKSSEGTSGTGTTSGSKSSSSKDSGSKD
jgi:putative FmdB family regulatory protein